jgi:hypothetical protein
MAHSVIKALLTPRASVIEPRQKLLSVISNPVQVMHSLESAYGNWLACSVS